MMMEVSQNGYDSWTRLWLFFIPSIASWFYLSCQSRETQLSPNLYLIIIHDGIEMGIGSAVGVICPV